MRLWRNWQTRKTKDLVFPRHAGSSPVNQMCIRDRNYTPDKGWHDGRIVPYAPLALDPASTVFHYGQEMFEGLKAYQTKDGKVQLFRPDMNAKRTNNTNQRMCMPQMDEALFVDAVKAIVDVDRDWIPQKENTALYIRPFIIATQPKLGVAASDTYLFIIIQMCIRDSVLTAHEQGAAHAADGYVRSTGKVGVAFATSGPGATNLVTGIATALSLIHILIRINSQSGKGGVAYILETNYGYRIPNAMREEIGYLMKHVADVTHQELTPSVVLDIFTKEYINRDDRFQLLDASFKKLPHAASLGCLLYTSNR